MRHHRFFRPLLAVAILVPLVAAWAVPEGGGVAEVAEGGSVFREIDLLVDIRHDLVQGYVEEPDTRKMVEHAVRGMVESLEDPYTTYLTTEELEPFERYVRASFTGIGAEIDMEDGRPLVVTPLEDSPAWNAGLLAGDVILEIDGASTQEMPRSEVVTRLQGDPGTKVRLRVRHETGEEAEIQITRAVINIQTVRGFLRDDAGQYDYLLDDQHRIGYLRITQFSETTTAEVRRALEQIKAQGARALILDVRFNPGGLLQAAVEISDMFLPAGQTVVSVKGRKVREQVYAATDKTVLPDIPVVVLANEASASAAEIVTGALSDSGRALFVGARTFGKGSVQQVKMLEGGGGALKMTNAYYYIPSGRLIHRRADAETWGVDPTDGAYVPLSGSDVRDLVRVRRESDVLRKREAAGSAEPVTPGWVREHLKDPQLAAAVEAVLGRLETGEWPRVGESNTQALVRESERKNLEVRRDRLREQLDLVEEELRTLAGGEPTPAETNGATLNGEETVSPTDPAAVQKKVDAAETREMLKAAPADTPGDAAPEEAPVPAGQP